jgi:hypothetical protein
MDPFRAISEHTYMHACTHTYIIRLRTHIICIRIYGRMHTYMHEYIDAYIQTYDATSDLWSLLCNMLGSALSACSKPGLHLAEFAFYLRTKFINPATLPLGFTVK